MARRVTEKDIIEMNEAYLICKSYTAVANATGWSASTVKKYTQTDYKSQVQSQTNEPKIDFGRVDDTFTYLFKNEKILTLTPEEREEIKDLWEEMYV